MCHSGFYRFIVFDSLGDVRIILAFVYGSWTLILLTCVTYMYYSNHAVCPTHWYSWLRISALCQLVMH